MLERHRVVVLATNRVSATVVRLLVFPVWWSAIVATPAVSIIREAGGDHVGSSVVVEVAPGSLPSSVESSFSIVVVVVVL